MALKPFYNKKGHLGMTRQQLLEKLNGNIYDPNDPNIARVTRALSGKEFSDLETLGGGSTTLNDFPIDFNNIPETIYFTTADPNRTTIPMSLSRLNTDTLVPGYDDPVNIAIYSTPPIRNVMNLEDPPWFYQYSFVAGLNIGILERILISFAS